MPRWQSQELAATRGGSDRERAQSDFRLAEPGGGEAGTLRELGRVKSAGLKTRRYKD